MREPCSHWCFVPMGGSYGQPICLSGRAAKQGGFLVRGMPGGEPLKRIPQDLVAACTFVDGEIALEHRASWTERGDAGLDIGAPRLLQVLRGGRLEIVEEIEADHLHAEAA